MRGAVAVGEQPNAAVRTALAASPSMDGLDLATHATTATEYTEGPADAHRHIVAYDYGMKRNIRRLCPTRLPHCAPSPMAHSPSSASAWATSCSVWRSGGRRQSSRMGIGGGTIQYGILRPDKYLSRHKTTASRSGVIRAASPVPKRLRARPLTSTTA